MSDIKGKFPNGLAAAMKRRGVGSTKLGKEVGESKQNVTRWANQSRKLPAPVADKMAPVLGVSAAELLLVDAPIRRRAASKPVKLPNAKAQAVNVPLVSWVSAGKFAAQDGVKATEVRKYLVADLSPKGDWIALVVSGNSMDRVAPDGATIFVDRKDTRLKDGDFYVFVLPDGETTFKRYKGGHEIRLQPYSTDPDQETIHPTEGMEVIGRVKRAVLDL